MYSGPHNPAGPESEDRPIRTATKNRQGSPCFIICFYLLLHLTKKKPSRTCPIFLPN